MRQRKCERTVEPKENAKVFPKVEILGIRYVNNNIITKMLKKCEACSLK